MKYKKYSYILLLILMLVVGINKTYASDKNATGSKYCYYISEDGNFKASLKINWGYRNARMHGLKDFTKVSIDKIGEEKYAFNSESILNWWENLRDDCTKNGYACFTENYYDNSEQANKDTNPTCPHYLVFEKCNQYKVWGTESKTSADKALSEINKKDKCIGNYASYLKEDKAGHPITSEEYYGEFITEGIVKYDLDGNVTCEDDYNAIFGSKEDEDSISYMVHKALSYVRIIVPILVILLGSLDFAKAVIAGKPDEMKKAQTDFIKRVIIGVAVFFVPLIVDIVMQLADIIWAGKDYIHCDL